jgi:methylamine--corrinoid protein Co-methyltransferase
MQKIDYEYMASVLEKADTGPVLDEKEWDQKYIGAKVKELIEKYDIAWNDEDFVPSNDDLADRLFQAGWELALESGVFCLNTKRQMVWDQDELQGTVDAAPSELPVGVGDDQVVIKFRKPEEAARVTVLGGAYGTLIEEELFGEVGVHLEQDAQVRKHERTVDRQLDVILRVERC